MFKTSSIEEYPDSDALDSEAAAKPVDPLASLEKSTAAKTLATNVTAPRIEELYELSDKHNFDPYVHSKRIRRYFREEKKVEKAKEAADNQIKDQFALPKELKLVEEKDVAEEAKESWKQSRLLAAAEKTESVSMEQTFAQARQAQSRNSEASVERRTKGLPSNRQASTLGAILLRNTLRSAKKRPPDNNGKSIGIVKR
jgi:coiled-coil domain-containing protein 130